MSCASNHAMYADISAEDSDDSQCSSNYWEYLDSMILKSRMEIAQEKRLLNEVSYQVNNFKLIVGLSVARGMLPAVKIVNSMLNLPEDQTCITLADFDWYEFLEKVSKMVNETAAGVKDSAVPGQQQALSENFTLYVESFFGEQALTLTSNNCALCFCLDDIKQILTVCPLINYRLELVKDLNFIVYYDDCLQYLNVTHNVKNGSHLLQSIISMCNLNKCERSCYFLELATMNLNKIVRDLDKLDACCTTLQSN